MRLVDRPACKPMRCAAIPFIAQTTPNVRWVDTGSELDGFDNHVYLSSTAVEEAGKVLGLPSKGDFARLKRELEDVRQSNDALVERVVQLERELEEANQFRSAVDVIESADFRARRKPGRPKVA